MTEHVVQHIRKDAMAHGVDPDVAMAWVALATVRRCLAEAEDEANKAKRDWRDRSNQLDRALARGRAAGGKDSRQWRQYLSDVRERQNRATQRVTKALALVAQWHREADETLREFGPTLFQAENLAQGQANMAVVRERLAWIEERKKAIGG